MTSTSLCAPEHEAQPGALRFLLHFLGMLLVHRHSLFCVGEGRWLGDLARDREPQRWSFMICINRLSALDCRRRYDDPLSVTSNDLAWNWCVVRGVVFFNIGQIGHTGTYGWSRLLQSLCEQAFGIHSLLLSLAPHFDHF